MRYNKTTERFFPSTGVGFFGRHCYEIVHGTSEPRPECPIRRSRESLRRESMELFRYDRWFDVIVDPLLDEEGRFDGAVHIVSDITERKRAEEAMKLSEERFRVLSEMSPLGMTLIDSRGRYEYINPAFVSIFGYTLNDVPTGADWFRVAFPDPETRSEVVRAWKEDLANSGGGWARLRTFDVTCRDGARKSILFRSVSLAIHRQFVIYEDVTRQRELQAQLQQAMKMEAVGRLAGGSIEAYSEVGIGTTFRIYLPRVEDEVVRPEKGDQPTVLPGGTETVLVVEDDDLVRTLCVQILERLGYKAMQARSGAEAIAVAQAHGEPIDLLLTDVVMPGINGAELATQLVLHCPEIKVLFTSGYTDDAISHRGVLDEGVSFIGKPYTPSALAGKVREVLDKA